MANNMRRKRPKVKIHTSVASSEIIEKEEVEVIEEVIEEPTQVEENSIVEEVEETAVEELAIEEIEPLLADMLASDAPPTCPHGRPLVVGVTRSELEKRFRRINN